MQSHGGASVRQGRANPVSSSSSLEVLMYQRKGKFGRVIRDNLGRAAIIAFTVGTVLVLINHGDHIEKEPICDYFFLKCGLCYFVPFSVSMVSGILAARRYFSK